MSEAENQRDYESIRGHLLSALQSSHEQYDKAVLTLSTGLLGLSVAFIEPSASGAAVQGRSLLVLSWISLLLAIVATVLSLLSSQQATRRALDDAFDIYILNKRETLGSTKRWTRTTQWLNVFSAAFFLTGATLTVVFVILQGR